MLYRRHRFEYNTSERALTFEATTKTDKNAEHRGRSSIDIPKAKLQMYLCLYWQMWYGPPYIWRII